MKKTFVISLGGSIMYPDNLDVAYIKKFRNFILEAVKVGFKFVIITGGGKLCRNYQNTASQITEPSADDLDWLGIETTRVNGLLLKTIFKQTANPLLLDKKNKIKNFGKYKIVIGCGWSPGWSTDFIAVQTAIDFKIKTILNLSNVEYVYTADPKKDKTAKPIKKISWNDYLKIAPKKRTPGMNSPFDPVASQLAKKNNLTVIAASGHNLPNLGKIIAGKNFNGTIIQNRG